MLWTKDGHDFSEAGQIGSREAILYCASRTTFQFHLEHIRIPRALYSLELRHFSNLYHKDKGRSA